MTRVLLCITLPSIRQLHISGSIGAQTANNLIPKFPTLRILVLEVDLPINSLRRIIAADRDLEQLSVLTDSQGNVLTDIQEGHLSRLRHLSISTSIDDPQLILSFARRTGTWVPTIVMAGCEARFFGSAKLFNKLADAWVTVKTVKASTEFQQRGGGRLNVRFANLDGTSFGTVKGGRCDTCHSSPETKKKWKYGYKGFIYGFVADAFSARYRARWHLMGGRMGQSGQSIGCCDRYIWLEWVLSGEMRIKVHPQPGSDGLEMTQSHSKTKSPSPTPESWEVGPPANGSAITLGSELARSSLATGLIG
ncbi:hypothetical protein C8R46DRAFT_1029300 [Mycena filopes]|nr:hypothetical protein C8R46DRAFT_1029300 [Mycena filopes]